MITTGGGLRSLVGAVPSQAEVAIRRNANQPRGATREKMRAA
jgi:hypothetical protein